MDDECVCAVLEKNVIVCEALDYGKQLKYQKKREGNLLFLAAYTARNRLNNIKFL
jgi:hypothetical protein